jgi:hypothetical protein
MKPAATRIIVALSLAALAAACVKPGDAPPAEAAVAEGAAPVARAATSARLVERDVEAPAVFEAEDQALWDGRPSLGGVWVASPDAVDPERVILRNPANGKFVIGALFRRERLNPGPALQISSDAAAALGILAGQPAKISVVALRREEVPEAPAAEAAPAKPVLDTAEAVAPVLPDAAAVETTTLAAAAIARAEAGAEAGTAAAAAVPAATKAMTRREARAAKKAAAAEPVAVAAAAPLPAAVAPAAAPAPAPAAAKAPAKTPAATGRAIQIGIFSVEANARRAVDMLTRKGVEARILTEASQGKTFWRVIASPAADPAATLNTVKAAGFGDAYFVKS